MQIKGLLKYINAKASIAALIHLIVSFFTDRLFFSYIPPQGMGGILRIISFKGMFLIVLLILWHMIFKFINSIRNKTVNKTWLQCSLAYFSLLFILTLAVWPGLWEWDEFFILSANVNLHMHIWQSLMSNIIYIISLMLIPLPAGIVFVQIVLVSIITGYLLSEIFIESKCNLTGKIILWIPFLLPPVLAFAQKPMRLGLYSFIELLVLFGLIKLFRYGSWNIQEAILYVILISIVATWRTEGIYYFVIVPILIWIFAKQQSLKYRMALISFTIILTLSQYGIQKLGYSKTTGDSYEYTAYINPIQELVGFAATHSDDSDSTINACIEQIDKVFDTNILIDNYKAGNKGINIFWKAGTLRDHSKEDSAKMKKAYLNLILKYPGIFLSERSKEYLHSYQLLITTRDLMTDQRAAVASFRNDYILTHSFNTDLRTNTIDFMTLGNPETSGFFSKLICHPLIPQLALLLLFFICLVHRKYGYASIISLTLIRIPLVFLTAPDSYFMYYFPSYLAGMICLACIIYLTFFSNIRLFHLKKD